ncbi:MAG: hypothetical protein E7442_00570 [Ruminococcaceae bacterium]|nr:hypothetical protein [Oscillospiraceae bacterium]
MKTKDEKGGSRLPEKNRALLLVLLMGAALMILPGKTAAERSYPGDDAKFDSDEEKLCAVLEQIEGCGRVYVLLRQERDGAGGAVVVCDGAESAAVSLEIVRAVSAYTGLGSNKIIVLKMKNQGGN